VCFDTILSLIAEIFTVKKFSTTIQLGMLSKTIYFFKNNLTQFWVRFLKDSNYLHKTMKQMYISIAGLSPLLRDKIPIFLETEIGLKSATLIV
jgi:hypothetical protein